MEKVVYKLEETGRCHLFVGALPNNEKGFAELRTLLSPWLIKDASISIVSLVSKTDYWYHHKINLTLFISSQAATDYAPGFHFFSPSYFRPFTPSCTPSIADIQGSLSLGLEIIKRYENSADPYGVIFAGCPHNNGIRTALLVFMHYLRLVPGDHSLALERTLTSCPAYKETLSRYSDLTKRLAQVYE